MVVVILVVIVMIMRYRPLNAEHELQYIDSFISLHMHVEFLSTLITEFHEKQQVRQRVFSFNHRERSCI